LKNILLIEDDSHVRAFVIKGLQEEGFLISSAKNGEEGIVLFESGAFDLVLLDIMLPGMSGIDVCVKLRESSDIPIILLTALGTSENVALGLNSGADDYIVKPFKFIELIARINSILRRVDASESHPKELKNILSFADVEMNDDFKEVRRGDAIINLTSTEYRLLKMFIMNTNKVLSRSEILEEVWGVDFDLGTNVVDVYVNYLRKKLDKHGSDKLIHTMIGMGYVLKLDV
jgi:two-component system, OmpR family, copper resistance phosphate regulon response regulator CusR